MGSPFPFAQIFAAITGGKQPFCWQDRLYQHFLKGYVPGTCSMPTGLGKTSVIPIWLIALAHSSDAVSMLPRRLVYIVNRRTVVDQATDDVERVLKVLRNPASAGDEQRALCWLRDSLSHIAGEPGGMPLAISTLRGELADNGEWKKNPARPAIIIGTIDMIGSKLLFSGYGDGRYGRAHHAGLIGQDALVVHDEAHLSPAFDALLRGVAAEQARRRESRPIRVMSLSATTRAGSDGGTNADPPFGIEDEDLLDHVVSQRLGACKSLTIIDAKKGKSVTTIAEEAQRLGMSPARVLVYVHSPETAAGVAGAIEKGLGNGGDSRVALLTGTIRGCERDALAQGPILTAFRSDPNRETLSESKFLVSTSAGEVGADWDADHLVCDLTTLDSMTQRFGRVNRLGGDGRSAQIIVVRDESSDKEPLAEQQRKTAEVLKNLPEIKGPRESAPEYDASPEKLSELLTKPEAQAAFSPVPTILPATDIIFDHWSLTSIAGEIPGRPEVGPYLHGMAEWEPPDTHVAWRADLARLATAGGRDEQSKGIPCSTADLERVFEVFPLRSVEQLRDRTNRVQAELQKIAERLDNADSEEPSGMSDEGEHVAAKKKDKAIEPNPWVVLMRGGSAEWVHLDDIALAVANDAKQAKRRLSFATVVLPVEAGGLKGGMLDGNEPAPRDVMTLDVAEALIGGAQDRRRVLVTGNDGGESSLLAGTIAEGEARFVARHAVTLAAGDDEGQVIEYIEYRVATGQDREPGERVGLSAHNDAVASAAERMAKALGLDESAVQAVALAGRLHDKGKGREIWQYYANNSPHGDRPGGPIAKSDRYRHWKRLNGYRHELGSLHDVSTESDIRSLDPDTRDLVLHLIAAHHGWARPHFEPRHFDYGDPGTPRPTADNERVAVETVQRFARLQQRYGRWGLAWLESILRCADAAASASSTSHSSDGGARGGAQ